MKTRILVVAAALVAAVVGVAAEPGGLSLSASAGAALPLGNDAAVFGPGYGGSLGAGLRLWPSLPLELRLKASYGVASVSDSGGVSLSLIRLLAGADFEFLRLGPLWFSAGAGFGGFAGFLDDGSGSAFNPAAEAGLTIGFGRGAIRPYIEVDYAYEFGLQQGLSARGGVVFRPGSGGVPTPAQAPAKAPKQPVEQKPGAKPLIMKAGPEGLQVIGLELDPVFPVFFRYYETNPLGTLVVRNGGKNPIEGLRAELLVKQFMDNARECPGPDRLEPGAEARIPLTALFNESILGISEGTKVSGGVGIGYSVKGKEQRLDLTTSFVFYDRNATNWTDDRRAAAFVTAKDPIILKFAKNLAGFVDDARRFPQPKAFASALGVFESLRKHGMRYVIDPNASYEAAAKAEASVDFIQFPRQTLDFKAGDCDDLSVLTSALLEAIGARAAFVTVPGHIFVGVDLDITPDEARKRFRPDDLIIEKDRVWLPLEITALGDDFFKAWELGAREWREAASKGLASLYPVDEAWAAYPPVGFVNEPVQVQPPESGEMTRLCLAAMERYVERELAPSLAMVAAEMKQQEGRSPRLLNKLGVLYASSGLRERAKASFEEANAKGDYAPALLNLGNLAYMDKDFEAALGLYQRAGKKDAQSAKVLLAISRANHELENYGQAREYYAKVKQADPLLAAKFSYIELRGEEAGRAADAAGVKESVVWSD